MIVVADVFSCGQQLFIGKKKYKISEVQSI